MYPPQRDRPDKHTSRTAWENSWADDIEHFFDRHRRLEDYARPVDLLPRRIIQSFSSQDSLLQLDKETREICQLQTELAQAVVQKFVHDDFEQKWKNLGSERQAELILEGIYRASCAAAWLETKRGLCPDITLRSLASNHGEGYLRMLRSILPDTPPSAVISISQPIHVPHRIIDHILGLTKKEMQDTGLSLCIRSFRLKRAYFLTMALWNILLSFYGEQEEYATTKNVGVRTRHDQSKMFKEVMGKTEYRRIKSDYTQLRKEQVRACWRCGIAEFRLSAGTRLLACSKCNKIGRKLFYCSQKCQTEDWKNGIPRPHRVVCGKTSLEDESEAAAPTKLTDATQEDCIPQPDPGFKRSPALLHQLSFLQQPPYVDYTFIVPHPLPDKGVSIYPLKDKIEFLTVRYCALKNGDPMAVKAMYEILLPWAERVEFSSAKLKEQLEREYGLELYAEESCDLHPALSGSFEPLGTETTGPDDLDSLLSALEEEKDAFEVEVFKHDAVVIDTTITEEATGETRDVNEAVEESAKYNVVDAGYHRPRIHIWAYILVAFIAFIVLIPRAST